MPTSMSQGPGAWMVQMPYKSDCSAELRSMKTKPCRLVVPVFANVARAPRGTRAARVVGLARIRQLREQFRRHVLRVVADLMDDGGRLGTM